MDGCQFVAFWLVGDAFPLLLVALEELFQRRDVPDLIFPADGLLVGVDEGDSKVGGFTGVMRKIHLTYYLTSCTVTSVTDNTHNVNEEQPMLIDTGTAMKFHQYRLNEMRQAADKARLIADLPRKSRTFKLGTYRLTLAKEATPHVPRMV